MRRATMSATRAAVASVSSQLNQKKSGYPLSAGGRPALTLWALMTKPGHREGAGADQVAQHLPRPDRRELVDVADQEQVRAGRDCLDELVREDDVDHRGLVDHHQVRLQGVIGTVLGVASWLQLEQPVDGGGLMAGQLGEPLGGTAGRGGKDDLGVPGTGELDYGADGEALAAAGAAGQHRDFTCQGELDRFGLLGGEVRAGTRLQPAEGLVPVHGLERLQPVRPGRRQPAQGSGQTPF
jgi:hypothetical protein